MNCWHCNTELRWVGDHDADELTDDRYIYLVVLSVQNVSLGLKFTTLTQSMKTTSRKENR